MAGIPSGQSQAAGARSFLQTLLFHPAPLPFAAISRTAGPQGLTFQFILSCSGPALQRGVPWSHQHALPEMRKQRARHREGLKELVTKAPLVGLVVSESHTHGSTDTRSQQPYTNRALQSRTESRTRKRICPLPCMGASAEQLRAGMSLQEGVQGVLRGSSIISVLSRRQAQDS